jgi:hypothetical protein
MPIDPRKTTMTYRITPTRESNPNANYPDFHAVGYDGNEFATREAAEYALTDLALALGWEAETLEVFETESADLLPVLVGMARRCADVRESAFDAGFGDGLEWDYTPAEIQSDEWDTATINALGALRFGRHIGLSDQETAARESAWSEACEAYNRGCVAGVQSRRESEAAE